MSSDNNESKEQFIFNFFGPVGENIAHVDTMNVTMGSDTTMQVAKVNHQNNYSAATDQQQPRIASPLPSELNTDEGLRLLGLAKDHGWLDEHYMPSPQLTNMKMVVIAAHIARLLKIQNQWSVFGQFWQKKNLAQIYNKSIDKVSARAFVDEVSRVIK